MNQIRKRILVIGGGSDLGSAIVKDLTRDHDVIWTYWNTDRDQPGDKFQCDLREEGHLKLVLEKAGQIDALVTAAFPFMECDNFDFEGFKKASAFLEAHVYLMTQVSRTMNPRGKIVNILGQCVERGLPGAAFYSGAFAFLHNFGHSINAREGKKGTMSVGDILLGPADTREWDGVSPEVVARYKAKVKEFISPAQVAATVRFMLEQPVMPSTFKLDGYYGY